MNFLLADSFTDSLGRLTNEEQKLVKTAAFDLQMNPAHPSLQFHKLERAKDPNFASVRVNLDIRIIVHRSASSLLLCYVGHHDEAYQWAQRRKLETHPVTGAAQMVEIRERIREIEVPIYVEAPVVAKPVAKAKLFAGVSSEVLLSYGVPQEWIAEVLDATEDTLFALSDHLPREAAEALLELATGNVPAPAVRAEVADPFAHPDSQRRFRLLESSEELKQALEFPWDKWMTFLHPSQRAVVTKSFHGPARVSGSAGTGKTIVALHRAVYWTKQNEEARTLLATFSEPLAQALHLRLRRLIGNQPRLGERIDVHSLDAIALRLYQLHFEKPAVARVEQVRAALEAGAAEVAGHKYTLAFLESEWANVVDAWGLGSWEAYRDVVRLGRRTRLPEAHRVVLWGIFRLALDRLKQDGLLTMPQIYTRLANKFAGQKKPLFDHIVIDEAQDLSVSQLKFVAALGGDRPNGLFFAGDLGQRIFEQPFSWKALGVDIRGRASTLKVNYRTSHEIRTHADRLLDKEIADADGNREDRRGTVSAFNGPPPQIAKFDSAQEEGMAITRWLREEVESGAAPHSLGIFVRSAKEIARAIEAASAAGMEYAVLDENMLQGTNRVAISTMHLAKGLEFQSVAVMALDQDVIPSTDRLATITDQSDLEDAYNTERHLLYVACTRARDRLLLTGTQPGSEFLEDIAVER